MPIRSPLLLALACACPVVPAAEPFIDLEASVQTIAEDHFRASVQLNQVQIPGVERPTNLSLQFSWVHGEVKSASARGWNRAGHQLDVSGLTVANGRITGTAQITIQPDRWIPKDKQPIPFSVDLDLAISERPAEQGRGMVGGGPAPQAQLWNIAGTWQQGDTSGAASGGGHLPPGRDSFDMGTWDDGLVLDLNLGTKRRNWNNGAAMARYRFSEARDLSQADGITISLTTEQPRTDATVTLWLEEADGGWYYHTGSIPLAANEVTYTARFADFSEAEWIAAGNHMDQDFTLDTDAIASFGVGVSNPLGIGKVSFTVTGLELAEFIEEAQAPASVTIDGRMLSVNGHDVIPGGVFGGFAPDLPLRYRPGSLRQLHTLAGSGATNPVSRSRALREGMITDAAAMVSAVFEPANPVQAAVIGALEERWRNGLERRRKKLDQGNERELRNFRRGLAQRMSWIQGRRWLVAQDVLEAAGHSELAAALAALPEEVSGDQRDQLVDLNRQLMNAAFPGALEIPAAPVVPPGLFSLDCHGERTQPATFFKQHNWREHLRNSGRQFAENAAAMGYRTHLEFWNEPYLNWQTQRLNYKNKYFREDLATEGGPVTVKRPEGQEEEVVPHYQWRRKGDGWEVYDPTAFTFWSGQGSGWIYDEMFAEYASAVKETDPKVQVVAGWGFRWNEDHWAAWDLLYKPTIDRGIEWIDGVHEHHYQGDPTATLASYEVLTAYGVTEHGKWLYGYNTETNDLVDAPARGAVETPDDIRQNKTYRVGTYNLRDLIFACAMIPDKARSRSLIHNDDFRAETDMSIGSLVDLRGRLVHATSNDNDVIVAAAIDGTDPDFPRAQGGHALVVAVFNDHRDAREVALNFAAPEGTSFISGQVRTPWREAGSFAIDMEPKPLEVSGDQFTQTLVIPGRGAWIATIELDGPPPAETQVSRQQFFSATLLNKIEPGTSLSHPVTIDADSLVAAESAVLRTVIENIDEGEAVLTYGDQTVVLPRTITADNGPQLIEIPLELSALSPDTDLVFSVGDGVHAGYRVDMASVILTAPAN